MEFFERGLVITRKAYPPPPDRMTYPSKSVHQITLNETGSKFVERRLDGGKWHRSSSFSGSFTFVSANRSQEWLWSNNVNLISIEFSQIILSRVAVEGFELCPDKVELREHFTIADPLLQQIVLTLYRESQETNLLDRLYLESLQNTFLLHLLRHHCNLKNTNPNIEGGLTSLQLKEIIDYIDSNLSQSLGLAELAEIIKVSPPHFGRLFKQSMGVSPYQYVLQCRIQKAKELLAWLPDTSP